MSLALVLFVSPAWAQDPDVQDDETVEPKPDEAKPDEPKPEEKPEEKPAEPTIGEPKPEEKPAEPTIGEPKPDEHPATEEIKPTDHPAGDHELVGEGEFLDVTGEPPSGDEPAADEHAPPQGDHTLDQLMPSDADLVPEDEDGDGAIEPEELPIAFDVPDNLQGADYLAALKALVEFARPKVTDKIVYKAEQKQAKSMGLIMAIMLGLSAAGLLLLLVPLFLKKKYPGKEKLLWRGSVLGATAWISTMLVFTGAMFLLRTAKGATAHLTSPPLAITNAAFDAMPELIDFVAEDAPVIFEAPLAQIAAGNKDAIIEGLLENVSQFRDDLDMFKSLAAFFKSLGWLFGSLGTILVILAVVTFMASQKQVLGDILRLPGRAATGDPGSFGAVIAEMQKRTAREVIALICTIAFLIIAAVVSGVLLALALGPAVGALLDYVILNIYYILGSEGASRTVVWTSLFGIGVFFAFVLMFIILANAFFLGKAQKVWQQKWRHQIPAATYRKFWLWGTLSWLWVQALPIIFIIIAGLVIDAVSNPSRGQDVSWSTLLLAGPLILVIGLPIFVWLGQGFKGIKFLRKFDHLTNSPEAKKPATVAAA